MRTFHQRSRMRPAAAVAVIAGLAASTAVIACGIGAGEDTSTDAAGSDAVEAAGGQASQRLRPDSPPAAGVVLPEGSGQIDGYPVGFPYSDLGAAAMSVSVTRAQIGFDYDQAATVAGIYAASDDRDALQDLSRDAVATRRQQAGVPVSGDVPAPASYAATPIAFTVEELGPDYYAVNVLSYSTVTHVNGTGETLLYAGTQLVRWAGDDWKLAEGTDADIQRLIGQGQPSAAVPGTPAFERAGWIPIREAYS